MFSWTWCGDYANVFLKEKTLQFLFYLSNLLKFKVRKCWCHWTPLHFRGTVISIKAIISCKWNLPCSFPFQEFSSNSSAVWSRNILANLEHNEFKIPGWLSISLGYSSAPQEMNCPLFNITNYRWPTVRSAASLKGGTNRFRGAMIPSRIPVVQIQEIKWQRILGNCLWVQLWYT